MDPRARVQQYARAAEPSARAPQHVHARQQPRTHVWLHAHALTALRAQQPPPRALKPPPRAAVHATHAPPHPLLHPALPLQLHTVLLRSIPRRSPPPSILPSPPKSSFTASASTPITDYYHATRPIVTRVLASLITDPRASPSSVSALTAADADFAATRRLDYAPRVVPARPLSIGGFSQRDGVYFFQTFASTPKMTTLRVLLYVAPQGDYELHSLDFSTAFLQGSLHEEIWLRRPPGFTDTFLPGTQRHCPVHWTAAVRVAKYLATTSGMGLVFGGRQPVVLTGHCDSSYADDVETQRSTQGYCFSLGAGVVSWRSTRSSSVASSSSQAEIYAGAMAAQELHWLTFLLTDLGERPSSAPTLFADNKAMILLYREPRLESRVKHIDMRYFLLRELQRRS
ncbi:unnamed protein product [Closterium sp. NIES-54]